MREDQGIGFGAVAPLMDEMDGYAVDLGAGSAENRFINIHDAAVVRFAQYPTSSCR